MAWEIKMLCDICGKDGARVRRVTGTYGKGKNLLVIEQVPMVSCPGCGESYFTADTLHEIEASGSIARASLSRGRLKSPASWHRAITKHRQPGG